MKLHRNPSCRRPLRLLALAGFFTAGTLAFADLSDDAAAGDLFILDDLVVTATGYEQMTRQAPASISVLRRSEFEGLPFVDLTDVLRDVPGVNITPGKVGHDISLRGMSSDYTLILVDGRRQDSREIRPNNFSAAETGFIPPPGAIERIEVVRGPMSTLYGSDAMGGVINIITRKVTDRWGGSLGFDATLQEIGGRGDAYGADFYLSGPILKDKLGVAIYGRLYHRAEDDMGIDGASPGQRGARRAEHDNVVTRLTYTPNENHDIIFEAGTSTQRYEGTSGKTGTVGQPNAYDPLQRYYRDHFSLSHTGRWGFMISELSLQREEGETEGRLNNDGSPRPLEIDNNVLDAKLIFPLRKHMINLGAQYWDAEAVDGLLSNEGERVVGDLSMEQYSVFAEDVWSLTNDFSLTLGLRWDHHDTFGDHYSPRIYGVWNLSRLWVLKGGISEGFRAPRMTQKVEGIRGLGGQGTIPLLGNPDLQPETSRTYELGAYFGQEGGITASLVAFFNEFDDKIASERIPNDGTWGDWPLATYLARPINVDTAETRGGEASIHIPFSKQWSLRVNYTFTETEQTSGANKGQPLTSQPEHQVNGTLNWTPTDELSAWLRGSWRDEEWRNLDEPPYSGYAVFDLGGSYKLNQTVTFNAGIYNLFNKDTTDAETYPMYIDGRRLFVGTKINF